MSPNQAEKTLSAQEDEIRRQRLRAEISRHRLRAETSRQRLMAVQTEDLNRRRIEKIPTADNEEDSAYVEGKQNLEGDNAGESLAPVTERVTNSRSTKDASNPGRIKTISTTDSHVTSPYVYLGTARLRHVDDLNKEGMPSKNVNVVMVLRPAAGSTGNAGSADAFDLSLERLGYRSPSSSQGLNYLSFFLGCLTAIGLLYIYSYLVNLQ